MSERLEATPVRCDEAIRVLIVEDEIEAARLVTRRLSHHPKAHFDLGLPDADRFDTIASACVVARHLPIVVLTGSSRSTGVAA